VLLCKAALEYGGPYESALQVQVFGGGRQSALEALFLPGCGVPGPSRERLLGLDCGVSAWGELPVAVAVYDRAQTFVPSVSIFVWFSVTVLEPHVASCSGCEMFARAAEIAGLVSGSGCGAGVTPSGPPIRRPSGQREEVDQLTSIFEKILPPEEVVDKHGDQQDWGNYWQTQFAQVHSQYALLL
jgi:hypothetical protein